MVWGAGQHVIPANVDQQVHLLRRALGDCNKARRFVATYGRRGYRFIHDVVEKPQLSRPADIAGALWRSGQSRSQPLPDAASAERAFLLILKDEIVVPPNSDLGRLVLAAASLPAPLLKAAVDLVAELRGDLAAD